MQVAIIGGGIQGCTAALELAGRGVEVTLIERRTGLLEGASRHTEGKIHLGFVYAADPSLRTARLLARGAAVFAPALRRWLGPRADGLVTSSPFHYVVHRESMQSPTALVDAYAQIGAAIREHIPEGDYFGVADPSRAERLTVAESAAFGPQAEAVFASQEIAIDPDMLGDALAATVHAEPAISVLTDARVRSVDVAARTLLVTGTGGDLALGPFDHVVNCAWEGRLMLDATAGVAPPPCWSFRMKYFGRTSRPSGGDALPSTTIVLGPFGDVVAYPGGDVYCSWYPATRLGWSSSREPPDWPSTINGDHGRRLAALMAAGLAPVLPAAERVLLDRPDAVRMRGGVIYARGDTDVSDAASELHERHRVGPSSYGAYHSVDTGKFTLAPLFALQLADRITGTRRG